MKFLKDPLLHFLGLGLGLFLLYGWLNPESERAENPKHIVVDREKLLTLVQYRTKAFQPEIAEARLKTFSSDQLSELITDYVREEALHREAKALGLGNEDYIIKRRMIQKIEFITQGFAEAAVKVSDAELKSYYEANKARYRELANITFTHVFFGAIRRNVAEAEALAKAKLSELSIAKAAFSDAPKHGDRFPYGVNFVERTRDHVQSQFGQAMTEALFAMTPRDKTWAGPLRSPYGVHLAMVTRRIDDVVPDLSAIQERVKADIVAERRREQADKAVQAVVDGYTVEVTVKDKDGKTPTLAKKGS